MVECRTTDRYGSPDSLRGIIYLLQAVEYTAGAGL